MSKKGFSQTIGWLSFMIVSVIMAPSAIAGQPHPWQMGFQEAASPIMERVIHFHNFLLVIITVIAVLVTGLLGYVMFRFSAKRNPKPSSTTHNTLLEIIWTAIPSIIVAIMAVPTVKLLNYMDQEPKEALVVKITGHQWYWSYEYPDHDVRFDSYMIEEKDLQPNQLRLLEVDNRVIVPVGKPLCLQLTSADVLHSWAVPALGLKKDTVPGRLNQTWVQIDKPGVYYGQCSELCGMKHGFMPIVVEAVSQEAFQHWLGEAKTKFALLANPSQKFALTSLAAYR